MDDLLNLARADAGKVKLRMQEFYLNDLLAECCRGAQTLAGARNLSLECSPGADAPFHGDEELLRRLLMNLLDNAIRYTPPGGKVSARQPTALACAFVSIPEWESGRRRAPCVRTFLSRSLPAARDGGRPGLSHRQMDRRATRAVECISQPGVGARSRVIPIAGCPHCQQPQ